jgi:hypothetical protein
MDEKVLITPQILPTIKAKNFVKLILIFVTAGSFALIHFYKFLILTLDLFSKF